MPDLRRIAELTDVAIRYMNTFPNRPELPEYRQLTASLADETQALSRLLHDSVRLDETQHLQQDLLHVETGY